MSNDQYASYLDAAIQGGNPQSKKIINPGHARVGSTLTDGKDNDSSPQKHGPNDHLDKEVEQITQRAAPRKEEKKGIALNIGGQPELGEGVDFAAAGVKDLNNFKGYHNQDEHKNEEAERYTCPTTGAHFEFKDFCNRLIKVCKEKGQEKKIYYLTGVKEQLDSSYYNLEPWQNQNKLTQPSYLKNKRGSAAPIKTNNQQMPLIQSTNMQHNSQLVIESNFSD